MDFLFYQAYEIRRIFNRDIPELKIKVEQILDQI